MCRFAPIKDRPKSPMPLISFMIVLAFVAYLVSQIQ